MFKNTKLAVACLVALSAFMMTGCKKTPDTKPVERVVEEVDEETGIIELRALHKCDTLNIDGHSYIYTYDFGRNDSLPVVRNPQGLDYYDNDVHLTVTRDGESLVDKTYTQLSLRDQTPEAFHKHSALVGFTFNYAKADDHSALHFIITVGDPDETADMVYPMELKVNFDGSVEINKASNLETEPVRQGMTIDPPADGSI